MSKAGGGKSILLVEDEALIALAEKKRLEEMGYSVVHAIDGAAALRLATDSGSRFDAVLMDIDLGIGMDGTEAAAEILKNRDIPIVFLSSHAEPEVVGKTERISSYGYVVKNSGIVVLDASIKMALKLFAEKSERREAERQAKLLSSMYAALSQINQTIVRAADLGELASGVSQVAVKFGPFTLAWVGLHDEANREVVPLGFAGEPESVVRGMKHDTGSGASHRCLCGPAVRENRSQVVNDLSASAADLDRMPEIEAAGIQAAAVFPVRAHGEVWGIFGVYSSVAGIFGDQEIALMEEAAMDIGYAVEKLDDKRRREEAETLRSLSVKVLGALNEPLSLRETSKAILDLVKGELGLDAVGIRLRDGEDFPYFTEDGFDKDFLLAENSVLRRDDAGTVCREPDGSVSLECTCGMVLEGKCGPPSDMVTAGGSLWTNDSLATDESQHGEDPRTNPRDRCVHEGYRSIALIPVRAEGRIVGLLQLNDRRADRFTLESIRFFEGLTVSFGIALERKRAEEQLEASEAKFKAVFDNAPIGVSVIDEKRVIIESNAALERIIRTSKDGLASGLYPSRKYIREDGSVLPVEEMASSRVIAEQRAVNGVVTGIALENGELIWTEVSAAPLGIPESSYVLITQDITGRKRAEEAIRRQLAEKDMVLKEVHHRIKNNMASVESFLSLQIDASGDEAVRTALKESIARVQSTRVLYEKLLLSDDQRAVMTKSYIESLVDSLREVFSDQDQVSIGLDIADFSIDPSRMITLGIIVNELLTNAYKYAFKGRSEGSVSVRLALNGPEAELFVKDDGVGMPAASGRADHSAAPTRAVSGAGSNGREGFGLALVGMLADQLNGTFELDGAGGAGTSAVIRFKA